MDLLSSPEHWIALLTLTALEIVLGIDNIVFISIVVAKLPAAEQVKARLLGLSLALVIRILLLFSISWVIKLTAPLFSILSQEISGRDIILILGGLFLLIKATLEIHSKIEGTEHATKEIKKLSLKNAIIQILLLDIIFSLDSVITAVGMVNDIMIMIAAVIVAMGVMLFSARAISDFVEEHPTVKMLALSFLLLIGVMLVAEGLNHHIPKGYIYFALAFSLLVEMLNIKIKKKSAKAAH